MSSVKKKIDIVILSLQLKKRLKLRLFKELELTYDKIVSISLEDGIKGINKANLSKYFSSDETMSGTISQKSLLYLSKRYCIDVKLKINMFPYNEIEALKSVKALFGE